VSVMYLHVMPNNRCCDVSGIENSKDIKVAKIMLSKQEAILEMSSESMGVINPFSLPEFLIEQLINCRHILSCSH